MADRKRDGRKVTSKSSAGPPRVTPPKADPASGEKDNSVAPSPAPSAARFPIVGIGASAGGLAAFEAFFSAMPPVTDSGMAFVLVQHLSPAHKSILAELVKRYTPMQVFEAEDGMKVQPNCAYVIPPNRDLSLTDSRLSLTPPVEARGLRLPIDHLFRSLAASHRERAIGLVLSGTGSDGALGVRAIKGEGGMAMAQAPESAEHDGMPRAAIATGLIDYVLPPGEMPEQLIAYARHSLTRAQSVTTAAGADGIVRRVCALLRSQTGHDFSQYKETTLLRRMARRMALHQIDEPDDYLHYARENMSEVDALFRDLLIGVTNFFRDPEAFQLLEEKVLPQILENKPNRAPVRVWVCGCSTGEEAYSIAILLYDLMERTQRANKIQLFATDIDHAAVEHARVGTFPASIAADVPAKYLQRYFTFDPDSGTYRIQKFIRDLLVFSEQDLVKDPPFSRLDLVSCRNLLIYLNADVQKKLIPLFHYSLLPGGALFLGPSETIGDSAPLFSIVDRKWKLYVRPLESSGTARQSMADLLPLNFRRPHTDRHAAGDSDGDDRINLRQLTEQALLAHYAQVGVLINSRGEVQHIVGRSGKFLEPPTGDATMNILAMAREGLRRDLTVALHKAVAQRQPVTSRGLDVKSNGHVTRADLVVRPAIDGSASDLYLVIIEEVPDKPVDSGGGKAGVQPGGRIVELEQELRAKEEYLQSTLEEMETTNEELKSTNEEMQSVNEELQSTNEELETSKEELQSVNEELSTVNAELQDKVVDLSRLNNDMNNLLAGTGIGTVFVDHNLRISRFTPSATQVINLIPSDIGRPVQHVVSNLVDYDHLVDDIRHVLDTLVPVEGEVQVKTGAWYLMRIRPYRTIENVIEGVVLTLVDISERKQAELSLRTSEARFQAVINQAFAGVAEMDLEGRYQYVNDKFCTMLGFSRGELLTKRMHDVTHSDDLARNIMQFDALVAGGADFEFEKRYARRDGSALWASTRVNAIRSPDGAARHLVEIAFDTSERRRLESELSGTDEQLARDLEAIARVHNVGTMYVGRSSLQAVFDEIVDAAVAISGAEMGALHMIEPSGELEVVAQRGFEPAAAGHWNGANAKNGMSWPALQAGERVLIEDLAADDARNGTPVRRVLLDAGIRALQATPLVGRFDALLGVCSTYFRAPHRLQQRTLALLDLLARQTADIVERARSDGGTSKDGQ